MMKKNMINYLKVISCIAIIAVVAMTVACGSNKGDNDSPTKVSKLTAPQLTQPSDHGGGFGWANDKCYLCHPVVELKSIHAYSPALGESFTKVGEEDIGACLYCHGTNGLQNVTAETYQCTLCHKDHDIVGWFSTMYDGANKHDLNHNGAVDNADCVVCHEFSDMNGSIDVAVDFTKSGTAYSSTTDFCLTCHDGNGAFGITPPALAIDTDVSNIYSTYMGIGDTDAARQETADIHGIKNGNGQSFAVFRGTYAANTTVSCLSCHQVHSSDNAYLITENGESATLADADAMSAAVAVTESNFSQLCALCHATSGGATTDNGLTEVVHTSTYSSNCVSCHYHGAGHGVDSADLF